MTDREFIKITILGTIYENSVDPQYLPLYFEYDYTRPKHSLDLTQRFLSLEARDI